MGGEGIGVLMRHKIRKGSIVKGGTNGWVYLVLWVPEDREYPPHLNNIPLLYNIGNNRTTHCISFAWVEKVLVY